MPCQFLEQKMETGSLRLFSYGRAVFLSEDAALSKKPTLPECWNASGSFVFLSGAFSPELSAWLAALWKNRPPRFSWLGEGGVWTVSVSKNTMAGAQVLGFGPYRLVLRGGMAVECGKDGFRFTPQGRGTAVSFAAPGIVLRGQEPLQLIVGGPLSPEGSGAGGLVFSASGDPKGENLFELLGAGLSFAAAPNGLSRRKQLRSGFTARMDNPVFSLAEPAVLSCRITPSSLCDKERTRLALPQGSALNTMLRTPEGRPIQAAAGTDAGLVFQRRAVMRHRDGVKTRLYLGLDGEFQLNSGDSRLDLLCGLAGTEFLRASSPAAIRFSPGGGAFLTEKGLSDLCTTSYVQPSGRTAYYTQAKQSPFFTPGESGGFLFKPLALSAFPRDGEAPAVPLLPYAGACPRPQVGLSPAEVERRLSKVRLEGFAAAAENRNACVQAAVETAVSPHGLLAGLTDEGGEAALDWAAFGNVGDAPSACPGFRVTRIRPALRASLQSVSPCACYETAEDFSAAASVDPEGFSCTVSGWKLQAAPQHWRDDTALLFKYGTQASLRDCFPASAALQSALSSALDETGAVLPNCQALLDAIRNPAFQGVLVLNCPLTVDPNAPEYCKEWAFLVNSLDRKKLFAKYFIVYHSEAALRDGRPVLNPSRFSAYMDYQNPVRTDWNWYGSDFLFQTVGLRLMLQDGAVQSLESKSELMLGRLFGSPCGGTHRTGEPGLVLDGRFFDGVQRFSLQESRSFRLTGSALERVDIESVLCTAEETSARFLLGGRMHFQPMDTDLFSYGAAEESGGGLRFEGLILTQSAEGSLSMSYGGLTLRAADSVPRPGSWSACFPAVVSGFRSGTEKTPPEKLGFTSIRSPVRQGAVSGDWFGLEYRVPLGGLGSLAPEAGPALTLLFAWLPGEAQPALYTGIKLGSASWKLQGLFEMGFSSVGLELDTSCSPPRYFITMEQFALRLLGISLPPGENRLFLFAGEDGRELGWYAAYQNKPKEGLADGG